MEADAEQRQGEFRPPALHPSLRQIVEDHLDEGLTQNESLRRVLVAIDEILRFAESDRRLAEQSLEFSTQELLKAHEEVRGVLQAQPDIICLAGYMRVLTEGFVRRFRGKILNIHPSLLPAFKGVDTHHRALLAGVRIHGATVHFVDETLDGGPIVAQAAVAVEPGDTDDTLAERVLEAEHLLYPHALALIASGKVRLSGSRIVTSANAGGVQPALFSPPTSKAQRVL